MSSAVIGGTPANTVPLLASSASERPRRTPAAAAAPFLCRASVSALLQPANSLACWAFISSSIWGVKWGSARPAARPWIIPVIGSKLLAMWCAVAATVHFSAAVVFFQSASLSFSRRRVASVTLVSNWLASASPLAPMVSSLRCPSLYKTNDAPRDRHARRRLSHGAGKRYTHASILVSSLQVGE